MWIRVDGAAAAELAVRVRSPALHGAVGDQRARRLLVRGDRLDEPEAADLIRALLTERMLLPIARRIGGEQPELRASFVASQLVGLAVVRHIVGVEPMASASPEQLAAAIEPVFEHYLNGEWVLGNAASPHSR